MSRASARPGWSSELERRAGDELTVLRGEAIEQGEGELPFAPLTSALRPLVRARHPAFDALAPGSRAELAALLPGLEDERRTPERHDPSAQLRLFEAVLELLDVIGEQQPLLLILEDVHWADRSTRTFAAFLARSLRTERIAVRAHLSHRRAPPPPSVAAVAARSSSGSTPYAGSSSSRSIARSSPRSSPTSSAPQPEERSSSACSCAPRATRSTPRSCWRRASTAAGPRR